MLSVIIPAYNEAEVVRPCERAVAEVLGGAGIDYELIYVDDGSTDDTWAQLCALSEADARIRCLRFTRNFGKEAAIFAGLRAAKGDCCAVMDCDMQHPPQKLLEMLALWQQGYAIVEGKKRRREDEPAPRRLAAGLFYKMLGAVSGFDVHNASDFKLLDRRAVDTLLDLNESNLFFRAMSSWMGFSSATVEYDVDARADGASKWSSTALVRYALRNIASFTALPMHIIAVLGCIMLLVSAVFGTVALIQKLTGVALGGFTTVILLLLFIGSILMISLGIIGSYIALIYEEVKHRPRYIIRETR